MIPEEIITKLGLIKSNIQFGQSLIYGASIFEFKHQNKEYATWIMDCDETGKLIPENRLLIMVTSGKYWHYMKIFTEDILNSKTPTDIVLYWVNRCIDKIEYARRKEKNDNAGA